MMSFVEHDYHASLSKNKTAIKEVAITYWQYSTSDELCTSDPSLCQENLDIWVVGSGTVRKCQILSAMVSNNSVLI